MIAEEPARYLWRNTRIRAKRKGLPFNLDIEDLEVPEVCPVLGIPLIFSDNDRDPGYPTVDKVIPKNGYVKGNVRVISWRANWLKANATLPELLALTIYVWRETIHEKSTNPCTGFLSYVRRLWNPNRP